MILASAFIIYYARMAAGWAVAPSVSFTNLDAEIYISDQLVVGRTVFTFETSDDDETTVSMTSFSPYFDIQPSDDKMLVTKSCLTVGTYILDFTALHTDSYITTGTLTANVYATAPIFNNLPTTVSQIVRDSGTTYTLYTLDIDMGCVIDYSTVCSISLSPSLGISLQGREIRGSHSNQENSFQITVSCTVSRLTSSEILTLNFIDNTTTTTIPVTSITVTSDVTKQPTSFVAPVTPLTPSSGSSPLSSEGSANISNFFDFDDPLFVSGFTISLVLLFCISLGMLVMGWRYLKNSSHIWKSKIHDNVQAKKRSFPKERKDRSMYRHNCDLKKYPRNIWELKHHGRIMDYPANRNSRFSSHSKVDVLNTLS